MVFLTVYVLIVTSLATLFAWLGYLALRPRFRAAGPLVVVLWLAAVAFAFPIPIHGGFMMSGELWLRAVSEWQRDREWAAEAAHDAAFVAAGDARFGQPLEVETVPVAPGWSRVTRGAGPDAYLHDSSGLIFTDPLVWEPEGEVSWELSHAACQELEPRGSWALPTQRELYLFWRDGGNDVSPWGEGRFVSILEDDSLGLRLTSRHLGKGPEKLRCVARSPRFDPRELAESISMNDLNRFQLAPDRYR